MTREFNNIPIIHMRVKELLKRKGATQLQLAEKLNQDKDYLNSCFRKGLINKNLLVRISEYLDCNPFYLIREDAPFLDYATYKYQQYDEMECLDGLICRSMYKPDEFDLYEKNDLFIIIDKSIREYAEKKNKTQYDPAFWSGEGTSTAIVSFDKSKKE